MAKAPRVSGRWRDTSGGRARAPVSTPPEPATQELFYFPPPAPPPPPPSQSRSPSPSAPPKSSAAPDGARDRRFLAVAAIGVVAVLVGVGLLIAAGSPDKPRLEAATIDETPATTPARQVVPSSPSSEESTTTTAVASAESSTTTTAPRGASTTVIDGAKPSAPAASGAAPAPGRPQSPTEVLSFLYEQSVPFTSFAPLSSWAAIDTPPRGATSAAQYAPDPDKNGFMGLGEVDLFGHVSAAAAYEAEMRQTNQQLADTMQAVGMTSRSDVVRCGVIVVVLVGAAEPSSPPQATTSVTRFVTDSVPAVRAAFESRYGPC